MMYSSVPVYPGVHGRTPSNVGSPVAVGPPVTSANGSRLSGTPTTSGGGAATRVAGSGEGGGPPGPLGAISHRRVGSSGGCFLFAVIFLMFFIYFGYLSILLLPILQESFSVYTVGLFCGFHLLFLLQLGAFFKAVFTDPGHVPPHWGFYMGDESKRRRYCKVCNVWKPDRTHHCSACGRWYAVFCVSLQPLFCLPLPAKASALISLLLVLANSFFPGCYHLIRLPSPPSRAREFPSAAHGIQCLAFSYSVSLALHHSVLNMDHHCPWINNCVGFFNRRFFLQLLLDALACLIIVCTHTYGSQMIAPMWLLQLGPFLPFFVHFLLLF